MANKDSKRRPQASLTDLLAEHTRIAEQERQEIESKLREKEEEEKRRREEEEQRQKELLRQRLEEEKRRAQERFQRQQEKDEPAAAPVAAEPVAAQPVAAPPPKKSHTLLAVAATVVIMAGAAVAAWFLVLNDPTPELSVMSRQGTAVATAAARQADVMIASFQATQNAEKQAGTIAELQGQLADATADIERLEAKMTEAQKAAAAAEKAAEEARKAAEENGNGHRRKPRGKKSGGSGGGGGIKVKTGIFSGKEIVE